MNSFETRFKILALLVISSDMPKEYQNKIDIVAKAIDRKSQFALGMLNLVEKQVINYHECKLLICKN